MELITTAPGCGLGFPGSQHSPPLKTPKGQVTLGRQPKGATTEVSLKPFCPARDSSRGIPATAVGYVLYTTARAVYIPTKLVHVATVLTDGGPGVIVLVDNDMKR